MIASRKIVREIVGLWESLLVLLLELIHAISVVAFSVRQ
jgi:hypothetical protein